MLGLLFPCFWCFLNRESVLDSLPPLFLFFFSRRKHARFCKFLASVELDGRYFA